MWDEISFIQYSDISVGYRNNMIHGTVKAAYLSQ